MLTVRDFIMKTNIILCYVAILWKFIVLSSANYHCKQMNVYILCINYRATLWSLNRSFILYNFTLIEVKLSIKLKLIKIFIIIYNV